MDQRVHIPSFAWMAGMAIAACLLGGCEKTITLRRYPDFYTPRLRTVAVLDLQNDALQDNAGRYISRRLADAIQAAGTYGTIGPAELEAQLDQAGTTLPKAMEPESQARAIAQLEHIDAFVTGSVTALESHRLIEPLRPHGYFATGYGWSTTGYHGPTTALGLHMPLTRRDTRLAYAEARIQLVDRNGRTLANVGPLDVQREVYSTSIRPSQLLDSVTRELAAKLAAQISIVEVPVKINPDKALQLVDPKTGKTATTFPTEQKSLDVRINLPAQADRNELLLLITPSDHPGVLRRDAFVYRATESPVVRRIALPDLPEGSDKARFRIVLISGRFELLSRHFTVHDR
ncbi:MAG: hypothetical protein ACLFUJ_06085 [Phycisphaerae bacterium]